MKWIYNLKVSAKLTVAFGLIMVILLAVTYLGYSGIASVQAGMETMYQDRTLPIQWVGNANTALYSLRGNVFKYLLIPAERQKTLQAIEADQKRIEEMLNKYRET